MTLDELSQDPQRALTLTAAQVTAALAQVHAAQGRLAAVEGALVDRLMALLAQPAPAEDELLAMPAVAKRLGIPLSRVRELGRRGQLATVSIGKYVRVRASAVTAFMQYGPGPVDAKAYKLYSGPHGRRNPSPAPPAPRPDAAGARHPARGLGEHGGPVGAVRGRDLRGDGEVDHPDAPGEA